MFLLPIPDTRTSTGIILLQLLLISISNHQDWISMSEVIPEIGNTAKEYEIYYALTISVM
jgi:hypothetical protein